MTTPKEIVRVAALGDLHYPKISQEMLQGLLTQATEQADVYRFMGLSQTRATGERHEAWRQRRS